MYVEFASPLLISVLRSTQHNVFEFFADGTMYTLKFDWIGGNLYVGTASGYILACYAGTERAFSCYPVLSNQGDIKGLALDPNQG